MTMKKILTLLFIAFALNLNAQNKFDSIRRAFNTYFSLVKDNNPRVVEYLHPLYFTIETKDSIKNKMIKMQEYLADSSTDFKIIIESVVIDSVSDVINKINVSYCFIKSYVKSKTDISELAKSADSTWAIGMLYRGYTSELGAENVKYDSSSHVFTTIEQRIDYGIKDSAAAGWKFIQLKAATKKLISEEIPILLQADIPYWSDTSLKASVYVVAENLEKQHPVVFFEEAGKRLANGQTNDAGFLYYLGSLRYRYYLISNPDFNPSGEPAIFSSMKYIIGEQVNTALRENIDSLIVILDSVICWDKRHDYIYFSKTKHPEKHQEVLNGLIDLRKEVSDNKKNMKRKIKRSKGMTEDYNYRHIKRYIRRLRRSKQTEE